MVFMLSMCDRTWPHRHGVVTWIAESSTLRIRVFSLLFPCQETTRIMSFLDRPSMSDGMRPLAIHERLERR